MAGYERHYDYGLRGMRETAPRGFVRTRFSGGPGERGGEGFRYDYDHGYRPRMPNRVTARYNLDYVREPPVDPMPFGGDRIGRVGDAREYPRPYMTEGGTRTWHGGDRPLDWDHRGGYADDYRPYRGGYGRWF